MKLNSSKKYVLIAVFALVFIVGIVYITISNKEETTDYKTPPPEKVVEQYFNAWSNKNYPDMYAVISDGFKKLEKTAKDLNTFRSYAESQEINGINILSIKEFSNDGKTAGIDYSVEFILNNGIRNKFDGTFILKYRDADVIQGWKLTHPYGDNIDNS